MNTILWLVIGVAAFDGLLLTTLYPVFRRRARFDHSTLWVICGALGGFVIQALMFYSGAFLILQLATIAGVLAICLWAPRKLPEQ